MNLKVRHSLLHKDDTPGQMSTKAEVNRLAGSARDTCRVRGSLGSLKLLSCDFLSQLLPTVKLFIGVTAAMSFHCNLRTHSTELVAVRSTYQAF